MFLANAISCPSILLPEPSLQLSILYLVAQNSFSLHKLWPNQVTNIGSSSPRAVSSSTLLRKRSFSTVDMPILRHLFGTGLVNVLSSVLPNAVSCHAVCLLKPSLSTADIRYLQSKVLYPLFGGGFVNVILTQSFPSPAKRTMFLNSRRPLPHRLSSHFTR